MNKTIIAVLIFIFSSSLLASPKNSTQYGGFWLCDEGYKKSGEACERITAPQNARVIGNMWLCNEGYEKVENVCQKLSVPPNAYVIGNMWLCDEGYKKVGESCQPLTSREIQRQEEIRKIIAQQRAELKARGASGQSCQTEYQTGARVCLTVFSAILDCNEDFSGSYYDSCKVDINYSLETDHRGNSSINAMVDCEAEISYKSSSGSNGSDYESFSETHALGSYDTVSNYASIDFSFSSFDEAYSVKLEGASCKIQSLQFY